MAVIPLLAMVRKDLQLFFSDKRSVIVSFVVPIAIAGLVKFAPDSIDGDMYVLALPLLAGSHVLAVVAFVKLAGVVVAFLLIGGLSDLGALEMAVVCIAESVVVIGLVVGTTRHLATLTG